LTEDLINLLGLRRYDLAMTNADRLEGRDVNEPSNPISWRRSPPRAVPFRR
jgi:hypothetical protein